MKNINIVINIKTLNLKAKQIILAIYQPFLAYALILSSCPLRNLTIKISEIVHDWLKSWSIK